MWFIFNSFIVKTLNSLFSRRFLEWWVYENLHESIFELSPQRGINKNKDHPITFNLFNTNMRYNIAP